MLRKGVYPDEYMDGWKRRFYSHLNMEDITDADYALTKRVCKDFEIKDSGEYHDLYVQSDTFLLADEFENFRNMCFEIYELDPARYLTAAELTKNISRYSSICES